MADPAERRVWLSLAPDPNLVARIPGGVTARPQPASDDILAARREHIGPSLSVSYRRPLTIVRGWMQHLYDADGRTYLDAVNNVPHVGHCHPRVVEAGRRQMAVLNTNTRYLHERLVEYAGRLCATLPDPLRVCYFVNSGSEANELALRLARCVTGSRDTIVVDVGYHGNTNAVVEISPYKFNGPGGAGAPPHVHVVPTPDLYRGIYRDAADDAGARYAAHVAATVDRIAGRRRQGRRLHRGVDPELRWTDRPASGLPARRVPARAGRRGRLHRRRGAGRLRARAARTSGPSKPRASCPTSSRWGSRSETATLSAPS